LVGIGVRVGIGVGVYVGSKVEVCVADKVLEEDCVQEFDGVVVIVFVFEIEPVWVCV
jgi:hypothetical protein